MHELGPARLAEWPKLHNRSRATGDQAECDNWPLWPNCHALGLSFSLRPASSPLLSFYGSCRLLTFLLLSATYAYRAQKGHSAVRSRSTLRNLSHLQRGDHPLPAECTRLISRRGCMYMYICVCYTEESHAEGRGAEGRERERMSLVETEIWPPRDRNGNRGTPPATAIGRVLRVPSRSPTGPRGPRTLLSRINPGHSR